MMTSRHSWTNPHEHFNLHKFLAKVEPTISRHRNPFPTIAPALRTMFFMKRQLTIDADRSAK
jgi:hypothetical protein